MLVELEVVVVTLVMELVVEALTMGILGGIIALKKVGHKVAGVLVEEAAAAMWVKEVVESLTMGNGVRPLREILHNHKPIMDGQEVVVVGEAAKHDL